MPFKSIVIISTLALKLHSACYPSVSCEPYISQATSTTSSEVVEKFNNTSDLLGEATKEYAKINKQLDRGIKSLEMILKAEILARREIDKILEETKKNDKIKPQ